MTPTTAVSVSAWVRVRKGRWQKLATGSRDECNAALERWKAANRLAKAIDTYVGPNDPRPRRRA